MKKILLLVAVCIVGSVLWVAFNVSLGLPLVGFNKTTLYDLYLMFFGAVLTRILD
jgi:hypothetical protein